MSKLPKSIVIMDPLRLSSVYGPEQLSQIEEISELVCPPLSKEDVAANPERMAEVEYLFGGWGMPELNTAFLESAPNLKGVFFSAGTVKPYVSDELWERGIVLTNAHQANAVPVAEYCVAAIILSLKLGWTYLRTLREKQSWQRETTEIPGCYDATVGLVSLGAIGFKTLELLKPFKVKPLIYSTSMSQAQAEEWGGEVVSLDEIFERSDVISLHTPLLPSTRGMIRGEHIRKMRHRATFINTARGAVVNQAEMIEAMRERPDLTALVDVTDPEPPADGDEIFKVDNIHVTPHIAGSLGRECRRLGQTAIDECKRYLAGEDLLYQVVESDLARMA
ncbi:hydroxyacid dehydrogenase [Pelagicoccus sp. SDUM812005]|uniref:hydroxyacid dehydrogenase n=1 Tax=Pelagicoccus sp. SDUM812005 TaxID=3041257 RepID=UPI00280DE24D|nr:hydroxyacid dehydrogenase [Pelagicoccus sp. SDUM812005]MDQ8183597.1 hydroxyacid dehydrogenase [Pelagicoccus sp. SDUM812005]